MESKSTTPTNDTSVNSGSKKSEKLQSTISALILAGSGAIIATLGPDVYKTIKNEYTSTMDLRARASELLGAEQTLNELKKYPGASIKFDSKTNRWSVVLPPKKTLVKNSAPISPKKMESSFSANIPTIPTKILPDSTAADFDEFNKNQLLPQTQKSSNIAGDESVYSKYLDSIPEERSSKMPSFETLIKKLGLKNGDEIKIVDVDDNVVWIYGNIQKNDIGEEYRLRKAVINLKDRTIDNGFINNFYYLLEK